MTGEERDAVSTIAATIAEQPDEIVAPDGKAAIKATIDQPSEVDPTPAQDLARRRSVGNMLRAVLRDARSLALELAEDLRKRVTKGIAGIVFNATILGSLPILAKSFSMDFSALCALSITLGPLSKAEPDEDGKK